MRRTHRTNESILIAASACFREASFLVFASRAANVLGCRSPSDLASSEVIRDTRRGGAASCSSFFRLLQSLKSAESTAELGTPSLLGLLGLLGLLVLLALLACFACFACVACVACVACLFACFRSLCGLACLPHRRPVCSPACLSCLWFRLFRLLSRCCEHALGARRTGFWTMRSPGLSLETWSSLHFKPLRFFSLRLWRFSTLRRMLLASSPA